MRKVLSFIASALILSSAFGQQPGETQNEPDHEIDAKEYDRFVERKLQQTYPATAIRMLRECGNIQQGICIDIGCGTGHLDVELAKRSQLEIIGLDINPEMEPLFNKRVREAGLQSRIRFVVGDAQQLPFPDDYADIIVSRGTLIFIPDLAKCLNEVDRVLKPAGVAFLGGRYLYAPREKKMSRQDLQQIVNKSGVRNAEVIDVRGQWVKIVGPEAPEAARTAGRGPSQLAMRFLADYNVDRGDCLLICASDSESVQELQRGFLELTECRITAIYPSGDIAEQARSRIRAAEQQERISCRVGKIDALPFTDATFDAVAGVGPLLIWSDRQKAMRELYRVLRPGGCALVGGRYLHMPAQRRVSSKILRADAQATGISSINILDDQGQWVEIRRPAQKQTDQDN